MTTHATSAYICRSTAGRYALVLFRTMLHCRHTAVTLPLRSLAPRLCVPFRSIMLQTHAVALLLHHRCARSPHSYAALHYTCVAFTFRHQSVSWLLHEW